MRRYGEAISKLSVLTVLLGIPWLAGRAAAQVDERQAEINAAVERAADNLDHSLRIEVITTRLSVGQLLDRDGGDASLLQLLRHAPEIGGPRWITADYCQVRIEISGKAIAQNLEDSAALKSAVIGVSITTLQARLSKWNDRMFTSTGASACGDAVLHLMPPPDNDAWAGVPAPQRAGAIAAARLDAARVALASIADVSLADGATVGAAVHIVSGNAAASTMPAGDAGVAGNAAGVAVTQWIIDRPVTRVEFQSDRSVAVELYLNGDDLASELQMVLKQSASIPLPADHAGWARFHAAIAARMAKPIGHATAAAATPVAAPTWAATPPTWIDQTIEETAAAPAAGPPLIAAQKSQAMAIAQLQSKVRQLRLDSHTTIGDAADHDPKIAAALARALSRARVYQADYRSDGTVKVGILLDLRGVWEAITTAGE